jgi:hypothetical protein
MNICRTSGKLVIHATQFHSWSALAAEIAVPPGELAARCVFSDLHLGAWKGQWLGRELYAQLGLAFPAHSQPRIGLSSREIDESRYIGSLTDHEGRGDFNTLLAHQLASEILDVMQRRQLSWIVVIAPAAPATWGSENALLVEFLAQGCRDAGVALVLVFAGAPALASERWELRWLGEGVPPAGPRAPGNATRAIPGIIPLRFAEHYGVPAGALVLGDGRLVLSPLSRELNAPVRDILSGFLEGEGSPEYQWLAAYCFCDDLADDDEVNILFASARQRSAEGGNDVVLELLARAKRKTTDANLLGWADAQRQNAIVRLRRWDEAAAGPLPTDDMQPSVRLLLYHSKAWGLVMTNRAHEAEPYLETCRGLMRDRRDSKFYLYLLNISALNKLRLGDFVQALAIEKVIERGLAAEQPTDWHATYINTINQARLYKRAKDLAAWESYYRRAFAITEGLRSESDLFYTCLCFAQLEDHKGNHASVLVHWLRAALHWLSAPVPEATAPRVVEAVTHGPRRDFVEEVSQRVREQLTAAWTKAGRDSALLAASARAGVPVPVFARIEPRHTGVRFALGDRGWSVFVAGEPERPRFDGAAYLQLAWCVWQAIRALSGPSGLPDSCAVLTDAQFGSDLPQTRDEVIDAALRFGVTCVRFGSERLTWSASELANLRQRAHVELAPGVAVVDDQRDRVVVSYKRYLQPLALAPREADLVRRVISNTASGSLTAPLAMLGELEAKRVLRIRRRVP